MNIKASVYIHSVRSEEHSFELHTVRVECKVEGNGGFDHIAYSSEDIKEARDVAESIKNKFSQGEVLYA